MVVFAFLPEKTALVCSVDAAVIESVKKPGKDIYMGIWKYMGIVGLKFDSQTLVQQGEWWV